MSIIKRSISSNHPFFRSIIRRSAFFGRRKVHADRQSYGREITLFWQFWFRRRNLFWTAITFYPIHTVRGSFATFISHSSFLFFFLTVRSANWFTTNRFFHSESSYEIHHWTIENRTSIRRFWSFFSFFLESALSEVLATLIILCVVLMKSYF